MAVSGEVLRVNQESLVHYLIHMHTVCIHVGTERWDKVCGPNPLFWLNPALLQTSSGCTFAFNLIINVYQHVIVDIS